MKVSTTFTTQLMSICTTKMIHVSIQSLVITNLLIFWNIETSSTIDTNISKNLHSSHFIDIFIKMKCHLVSLQVSWVTDHDNTLHSTTANCTCSVSQDCLYFVTEHMAVMPMISFVAFCCQSDQFNHLHVPKYVCPSAPNNTAGLGVHLLLACDVMPPTKWGYG